MGNSSSSKIIDKGKILLKLTYRKSLALHNVLYVPSLHRNLISGALLSKVRVKLVFKADKHVLTCNREYVGQGYLNEELFVLDIVVSVVDANKASTSTYIAESIDLWHARLGHVNIQSVKKLKRVNLVPNLVDNRSTKSEICL